MDCTVLVVDDNPKNLQVIAAFLSESGYQVEVALSGYDALKWVEDHTFDAILLDVMMPEMNGFETCQKIKQNPSYDNTPIIFLTARDDMESFTNGFDVGGVDFLTKPFNQKELLVRLSTHVELKRGREKLLDINKLLNGEVERKTTELRESNQQLAIANENLKMLDVAKNNFLNSISHELRTSLNGIVGSIALLQILTYDKHVQEIVSLLDSSVNNLEKYSYAALLISNLQLKGESQLKCTNLDLLALIETILKDFTSKSLKKGLSVNLTADCEDALVYVDSELIKSALIALLDISLQYTKVGYITIHISQKDSEVCVAISDSGVVYEGNELNHDFKAVNNANYTSIRNNAMELYLAQTIIVLHNGSIHYDNIENQQGTITQFSLPVLAVKKCGKVM
jgi:two-component system sensor histidine kinase/response regulator